MSELLREQSGLSWLEKHRTSSTYRRRLEQCLTALLQWCDDEDIDFRGALTNAEQLNEVLCRYVDALFRRNGRIWQARHAVLSVQTEWRQYKHKLHRAWDAVKAWELRLPSAPRTPLPEPVLLGMVAVAISRGLAEPPCARWWWSWAVLVQVGFYALLRPGGTFRMCSAVDRGGIRGLEDSLRARGFGLRRSYTSGVQNRHVSLS